MQEHEKYMHRCLQLASKGIGNTYPNPLVGSVIVFENKIIGEGFHQKAGENHAEINAINSVKDKSLLSKSTLYVNLEPCSHFGKTPPCAVKIVELKIPKVVIGTIDTTDKVAGKGIEIMRNAGIEVIVDVLKNEARKINKRFFTFHEQKRPYIILKWAQTTDGFIDPIRKQGTPIAPFWISGELEKTLVHKWRTEEQTILVGKNTAIIDNPELTARNFFGKNPTRILIDRNLSTTKDLIIFNNKSNTIIFNYLKEEKIDNLVFVKIDKKLNEFDQIFFYFYSHNLQSVIIEGGAKILQSFYDNNYWDEARIFIGNKFFNTGVRAPKIDYSKLVSLNKFKTSTLYFIENHKF